MVYEIIGLFMFCKILNRGKVDEETTFKAKLFKKLVSSRTATSLRSPPLVLKLKGISSLLATKICNSGILYTVYWYF